MSRFPAHPVNDGRVFSNVLNLPCTSQRAASSSAASSRKFAILSFNLALLELKKIEPIVSEKDSMEKESYKNAAAFWAASAAELFADCDDESKAEQALALAVLGKAFLIGGDHESAYSKLRLAYELNAENLYVSSAVTECLCQQVDCAEAPAFRTGAYVQLASHGQGGHTGMTWQGRRAQKQMRQNLEPLQHLCCCLPIQR